MNLIRLAKLFRPEQLMSMRNAGKPSVDIRSVVDASKLRPMAVPGASAKARPVSGVARPEAPVASLAPAEAAEQVRLNFLKDKFGIDLQGQLNQMRQTKGLFMDDALTEAAIMGGGALLATGAAGLGGADGGDALASGLLGAGVAAAPVIHNAVRKPSFRSPALSNLTGRQLVGTVAAGAGAGTGANLLAQAAFGNGQTDDTLLVTYTPEEIERRKREGSM